MEVEEESDIEIKGRRKEEVFEIYFFCSRTRENVSFFCFRRNRPSDEETCVEWT